MRTTNKRIETLARRLAALTQLPLVVESNNPGDYTRYRLYTQDGPNGGVSERPFGHRSYRKGEFDGMLCTACAAVEAVLPDDVIEKRMSGFHQSA